MDFSDVPDHMPLFFSELQRVKKRKENPANPGCLDGGFILS